MKYILDTFNNELIKVGKEIDKTLLSYLKVKKISEKRLNESLLYSSIGSGKRLRAFMLIETAKIFSSLEISNDTLIVATALELIHTYSLIHDDLPSMDNSFLRRGKKTSHMEFDEATAILLGDGLQSLAFEMISKSNLNLEDATKLKIISDLSQSIGFIVCILIIVEFMFFSFFNIFAASITLLRIEPQEKKVISFPS